MTPVQGVILLIVFTFCLVVIFGYAFNLMRKNSRAEREGHWEALRDDDTGHIYDQDDE